MIRGSKWMVLGSKCKVARGSKFMLNFHKQVLSACPSLYIDILSQLALPRNDHHIGIKIKIPWQPPTAKPLKREKPSSSPRHDDPRGGETSAGALEPQQLRWCEIFGKCSLQQLEVFIGKSHIQTRISIYLSIYLPIYLSISLSINQSINQSIYLSIYLCIYIVSTSTSINMCIYIYFFLNIYV